VYGLRTKALSLALALPLVAHPASAIGASTDGAAGLEADLENVRKALGIPGMAAAVVHDGEMIWAAGFGLADVENQIEATPNTPFGLASVTKPIAAALIMQLAEEGLIDLGASVASYGVDLPRGEGVTVRHLLTHTSEGTPGTVHEYNGSRYAYLGGVIEGATGRTFSDLLGERVLVPLGMMDTALNPINSWGEISTAGLGDFRRALGWGETYDHYPDVYQRLAHPYQFEDDYSIIPGMYHLTHNPAAGGISSVTDLARFDIALEAGSVLGDAALQEMFTPAVQTLPGRYDLGYGLGWYVQDFEGMRLTWHTGRWAPSTSALYLKARDLDLTFVVLANTDNMTVPFQGIGNGDLSKSLLALTFLHHFGYPEVLGVTLPAIEWSAGEQELLAQLTAIDDVDARRFLERELWSYRQALASSGQFERAELFADVARRAFPGSSLRRDQSITATVGKMPYVAPIPSAASLGLATRVILVWFVLILVCLVWMAFRVFAVRDGWWAAAMWLLGALLVGPIAIVIHRRVHRGDPVPLNDILCASVFCVVAYSIAWVGAVWLLFRAGDEPNPVVTLAALLVIPIVTGLLLVRAPMLRRRGVQPRRIPRMGLLAELITWSFTLAVFFSVSIYVDNRWLSTVPPPTSPYYGALASLAALGGLLALLALHWLMHRRGFTIWTVSSHGRHDSEALLRMPTLRDSWWMLLATLVLMAAGIVLAASAFGGG
jgi:CubicO group peptidase (beta-lactamase class C family)